MKGPEGFAGGDANIESEFPAEIHAPPIPESKPKRKKKSAEIPETTKQPEKADAETERIYAIELARKNLDAVADASVDSLDFDSIPEAIYDTDAPISEEEIAPANGFWGKVGRGLKLTGKYSWKGLKAIGKGGLKLAKKTIAKINDDIWPAFKFDYKDSRENGWFFGDRKKK